MDALNRLQDKLGYHFESGALLKEALSHRSAAVHHNQRLEFLGDAALDLGVSFLLYQLMPQLTEGQMTRRRALLVCEESLYARALSLGLDDALITARHVLDDEAARRSALADALEALLAAVFLEAGYEKLTDVVVRLFNDASDEPRAPLDSKGALQDYFQKRGLSVPSYQDVGDAGPDHAPVFVQAVCHEGKELARAEAHSKKRAQQLAAELALQRLESEA